MLSWIGTCRESRTKPSFVAREAAFGLGPVAILPTRESVMHHPSIPTLRWSRCVAWVDGNRRAADTEFFTTQRVIMFRIIAFVGQNPSRSKVGCRLPHRRREVGRVLTRALSGNRSNNQLRSRVKNSGQLWPSGMRRRAPATPSLKVYRGMPSLQSRCVDRRSVVNIVSDQATGPSTVAASRKKLFKPPFSKSFCSTCQSVE